MKHIRIAVLLLVFLLSAASPLVGRVSADPALPVYLPLVRVCRPVVTITHLPAYGSSEDLRGWVTCLPPASFHAAVFIRAGGGWWNKPTFAQPGTPLAADGSFVTDVTTGAGDPQAERMAVFILPGAVAIPLVAGAATLSAGLYTQAAAYIIVDRMSGARQIEFSGYTWEVKNSQSPVGPGPNIFSDSAENVWVDASGRLHLRITYRDGAWRCAEIANTQSLGYGKYIFQLSSRVDLLDPNMVLGLFTWDDNAPQFNYREIDIEFSRWGDPGAENAQKVVQPWQTAGNLHRFDVDLTANNLSTHWFDWQPGSVHFLSAVGHSLHPTPGDVQHTWTYTGADIPPAGDEQVRLNLWLVDGQPPLNASEVEVVVDAFIFAGDE